MEKGKKSIKLLVMTVALALLIVVSVVQAVELVKLKNKINSGDLAVSSLDASGNPSNTLQNNIQNLPTMVGGC